MERRRLFSVFLIVFANFLGGTVVLPTLPLYAQRHFDADPGVISLMLASFVIGQFLAAPWLGRLSDRYGRVPVLIVSQIGTFLSFLIMGTAASLPVLFAARVLDGITGGNVIVAQAYITDFSPREKRTQSLGIVWTAFGVGYILGPALGGIVGALFSDRATFFLGAAISFITVVITWLLLDEPKEKRVNRKVGIRPAEIASNHLLVLILVIGFMAQFSIALLQSTLALFGEAVVFAHHTDQEINLGVGLLLTCTGVGQLITQWAILPPMVKRLGERRLVVVGAVIRAVGFLSMAVFVSPWLIGGFSLMAIAIASGTMMPSLQSLATTSVSESVSGSVLGVYQSSVTLGIIIGTAIGGQLFEVAPTLPYVIAGTVLLLTTIPALLLMRRAQPVAEVMA
jgi:DHA1 family tetracycline resistance protein-like MFS transporter